MTRAVTVESHQLVIPEPEDKVQLAVMLYHYFGLRYPMKAVCPGHVAPFDALAEAYFSESPVLIWHASRGLAGKTTMLAGLSLMELVTGYDVSLLGGSQEQSLRTHRITTAAWDHEEAVFDDGECAQCVVTFVTSGEDVCYACGRPLNRERKKLQGPNAPRDLLKGEPLATKTEMRYGNIMVALAASPKSVRGPHPQRLRMDEADEMDLELVDAAMGQTMETDSDRPPQTIFASTHQHPSGTMTELFKRAAERGWPVREWCYKETLLDPDNPGSWLIGRNIAAKRSEVTDYMWRVEYDLETPETGGALFNKDQLRTLFLDGAEVDDKLNQEYVFAEYDEYGDYVTAADWGKTDLTVIVTVRYDVEPPELVYWLRLFRALWPVSAARFCEAVERYDSKAIHDATGIGDLMKDQLTVEAVHYIMTGIHRSHLWMEYENAVAAEQLKWPRLKSIIGMHTHVQRNDLYGSGHPPDEIVALSLANLVLRGTEVRKTKKRGKIHRPRSF